MPLFVHEAALSRESFIGGEERESLFHILQKMKLVYCGRKKHDTVLICVLDNWSFLFVKDILEVCGVCHPFSISHLLVFYFFHLYCLSHSPCVLIAHLLSSSVIAFYQDILPFFLFLFLFNRTMSRNLSSRSGLAQYYNQRTDLLD